MFLFYAPEIKEDIYVPDEQESKHIAKVLRLSQGDIVFLTDGKGKLFKAEIIDPNIKKCSVKVIDKQEEYGKRNFHLHLAVAPTKNISRYEWFIEKATELGIDEITPLICENSERKVVKHERLEKIAVAAMKQSLKAYLPVIHKAMNFKDFIKQKNTGQQFIAYVDFSVSLLLKNAYKNGGDCTILTGPEGDFSMEEIKMAKEAGFVPISLGKNRLRTETAAIAACHTINLINEGS